MGGEAEQRTFLSPKLHQLLQDGRVLLETHRKSSGLQLKQYNYYKVKDDVTMFPDFYQSKYH